MIDLRYVYNDQPVAEGERAFVYQGGRLFVRTGVLSITDQDITYRLREVYDADAGGNRPPAGGNLIMEVEVNSP